MTSHSGESKNDDKDNQGKHNGARVHIHGHLE
jgi:hypothetical protein